MSARKLANPAFEVVALFLGQARALVIPTELVRMTGDHVSALFLAQVAYWSAWATQHGSAEGHEDGWFHKTRAEWFEDCLLTPDQVRRCQPLCARYGVEYAKRGLPARGHFRLDRERFMAALAAHIEGGQSGGNPFTGEEAGNAPDQSGGNPLTSVRGNPLTTPYRQRSPKDHNKENNPPTPQRGAEAGNPEPQSPITEADAQPATPKARTGTGAEGGNMPPSPDSAEGRHGHGKAEVPEKVPGAARRERREASEREAQALVETWNEHRGALPEVQALNDGRRRAATKLLRDCSWDLDRARATLADATREIAADDWWTSRKLGFDVLMPGKVQGKAEAWRARRATQPATPRRRNYA